MVSAGNGSVTQPRENTSTRLALIGLMIAGTALFATVIPTSAEVGIDGAVPVSEDAPPLSEGSRPLGDSKSVHEGSHTLHEGTVGSMKSRPVRDSWTRSMKSGPVSDLSRGPMTTHRSRGGNGGVHAASSGAVKKDVDTPLGERISAPLRELGALQEILRERAHPRSPQGPNDQAAHDE